MAHDARGPRRSPGERIAAWLVTGPLGHLYSALADLAVFFCRALVARVRRHPRVG